LPAYLEPFERLRHPAARRSPNVFVCNENASESRRQRTKASERLLGGRRIYADNRFLVRDYAANRFLPPVI
jgi:hypothetical protein